VTTPTPAPAPGLVPSVVQIEAATAGLLARLDGRRDDDARRPSRLPGWTVGHVLTHIARNADAFVRVATDRHAGRVGTMYPGGAEGRNGDIEAGSGRSMAALAADLRAAGEAFAAAWSGPVPVPDGPCRSWEGIPPFAAGEVPLRRLREVEVHAVDTGLDGFDHHGWTEAFVEADLPFQWAQVLRRTEEPIHVVDELAGLWSTGTPSSITPVRVDRRDLLAWLLDRHERPDLPALLPWGRPDTWHPPR
jgi:maleylpyruvate isomerase